jgi:hypothetical protein
LAKTQGKTAVFGPEGLELGDLIDVAFREDLERQRESQMPM